MADDRRTDKGKQRKTRAARDMSEQVGEDGEKGEGVRGRMEISEAIRKDMMYLGSLGGQKGRGEKSSEDK